MKLFLTGGTGFFGKALLRHWQSTLYGPPEVCVLSRNPAEFLARHPEFSNLPWLRFAEGDVAASASLPRGERFSHVLHAAADSTLGPTLSPLAQYDQIVTGTRNLLEFALQCRAQRFLFTSSGAVYGPQPTEFPQLPENRLSLPDPLLATSAYGMAKRAAEHLCALYHDAHGLETVIARCFAFVGPDLPKDVHFAIGNFIRDALSAPQIKVTGDGTPMRSYLDQRDLAQWLEVLLLRAKAGQAYNVGSDQGLSVAELAHLVRDTLSPDKTVRILGAPDVHRHRDLYVPSIAKVGTELGLRVTIPLRAAIAHAAGRS